MGYVERRPDPDDRRAKRIYRTAKGKKVSETAVAAAFETEDDLRELLGEDRLTELRRQLMRIIDEVGESD